MGEAGADGDQGEQGATGPQGPAGRPGARGARVRNLVVSGFHTEGWGPWNSPPPLPEILKLSMVIIVVPSILAI